VLARIVAPLLDNAMRHARSQVRLGAEQTESGVRVTVGDDGPGVPGDFVPRLFLSGRRADQADGHPGAGLGLPLSRRLARSFVGEVTYEQQARGALFVVTLPLGRHRDVRRSDSPPGRG
jgi:signal transduction histidine kinase